MKRKFPKRLLTVVVLIFSGVSLVFGWGAWGHQHINRAAVFALPESMGMFFYDHIDFITTEAVVPDLRKYTLGDKSESPRHFINLEAFVGDGGAIDSLPRTMAEARVKYGESLLQSNGMLPWYIQEVTEKLTRAFQNKRKAEILFLAADLGHYVADAYMPLHTSLNHDGQLTNQKGIHAFWEGQIPETFGANYNFYTGDAKYIQNITKSTWDIIAASHVLVDTLLTIDQRLKTSLPLNQIYQTDANGEILKNKFKDPIHTNDYAKKYNTALNGMVENQIRGAIATTANLWYTAWVNAGKPNLDELDSEMEIRRNKVNYQQDLHLWRQGKLQDLKTDKEF